MLETEYNEEEVLKIVAEDARREGEKNGKKSEKKSELIC